jgi:hypothetical protein
MRPASQRTSWKRRLTGCVRCGCGSTRGAEDLHAFSFWGLCSGCYVVESLNQEMAHKLMAKAIRSGKFPRARELKCVDCGRQAHCYDHRDYTKPLSIEPVCASCNQKRGPAKWSTPLAEKNLPKTAVSNFSHWEGGEGDAGALL